MIDLRDICRRYGAFELGPLDLQLRPGEYWVLLGPSGAGKSLLLQLLAGLDHPDRGEISVDGALINAAPAERRGFAMVFQQPALFPHLDLRGNLAYGLAARGMARAERETRVDEMCVALGLEDLHDRPVAALSGGEARRVVLARALAIRPRLLLLDEPLAPLDHNARLVLQHELARLHREFELTTLHVTHSRDEARALASHCALLLAGQIVQAGPVDEIFAHPRCAFAATFLGKDEARAPEPEGCDRACLAGGRCPVPQRS